MGKNFFKNSEELLNHLFTAEANHFCLKWPKKGGNAYVNFNYAQEKNIQAFEF
jgi:hypothetical protein